MGQNLHVPSHWVGGGVQESHLSTYPQVNCVEGQNQARYFTWRRAVSLMSPCSYMPAVMSV